MIFIVNRLALQANKALKLFFVSGMETRNPLMRVKGLKR
jgi:hypothetical protein